MATQRDAPAVRISLLAIPDVYVSGLAGLYDTLRVASDLAGAGSVLNVEIVARDRELTSRASGMPIVSHRTLTEATDAHVLIVPNTLANGDHWDTGRHDEEVRWVRARYDDGCVVCSACSGALLLAEAGVLDGHEITTHWNLAKFFRGRFPRIQLRLEQELVVSGVDGRIVTSGASAAWHDLALYLIARLGGADLAFEAAKFFMLQWHRDGQALYVDFAEPLDHGDAAVLRAQAWLADNYRVANPVENMTLRSGLSERSFKRRFRNATGHSPIGYVQQVRIHRAKRLLVQTREPLEEVAWQIGYEDPSTFRRLFKRLTRVTPADYRRKFQVRVPAVRVKQIGT